MPIDYAGNTLATARGLNITPTTQTFTDWLDSIDSNDYYRFSLGVRSSFNLAVDGMSADANVQLIRDANNNGLVDSGEVLNSSTAAGTSPEAIATNLDGGSYYIRVYPNGTANTFYNLKILAAAFDYAGNTLATARSINITPTTQKFTNGISSQDSNDYYRFSLGVRSSFNLAVDGMSADANVQLIRDANNNGLVDSGEILNSSTAAGTAPEAIATNLDGGSYYIRVYPNGSANTFYNLKISAVAFDYAGNTLATARSINITPTTQKFTNGVSPQDSNDYYRFSLGVRSSFNLAVDGMSADANVQLIRDADNNGLVDSGEVLNSSTAAGTSPEAIATTLDVGSYYIRVYPNGTANTFYNLKLSATGVALLTDAGNTLGTAEAQSTAVFSRNEQVSVSDLHDLYRFTVGQSGIFTANLTGLSGDADVRLIQDKNNNNVIDQGEVLAWQWERGNQSESIRRFLATGTYFLQVMSYHNQTANYNVATNFTAATSDARRFSIQINFSTGSEALSDVMRNAVTEAAQFWENVISYSSFNSSHILTIDVGGTVQYWSNGGGALASAGMRYINTDAAGRWMPTSGVANINTNPDAVSVLSSNIDFFRRVMIHEFSHVLGIGTFWGSESYARNLVNTSTGTYSANTYAAWAYGELRGTFTQTAIPVTTGVGAGSDYTHWREEVFDNEIATHLAGGQRSGMPLSQMTIASLRDLGWNVNYGAAEAYSLPS